MIANCNFENCQLAFFKHEHHNSNGRYGKTDASAYAYCA